MTKNNKITNAKELINKWGLNEDLIDFIEELEQILDYVKIAKENVENISGDYGGITELNDLKDNMNSLVEKWRETSKFVFSKYDWIFYTKNENNSKNLTYEQLEEKHREKDFSWFNEKLSEIDTEAEEENDN